MFILKSIILYCFLSLAKGKKQSDKSYIIGLTPTNCKDTGTLDGIPVLNVGETSKLYVFGYNLSSSSEIGFTHEFNCDYPTASQLNLIDTLSSYRGIVTFTPTMRHSPRTITRYYTCLKSIGETVWRHQGTGKHVSIYVVDSLYSPWMGIAVILLCYTLSSLMSGLNLGLLSLDNGELLLLMKVGTNNEKKYASKIIPIRKNGNYLVCSIVITATLCNTVSTTVTDTIFSEIMTVIISTVIIVLFCEVLPQSLCSAHPLYIGARTIHITRVCMILTFPVSYPLSKLLNAIVGKELTKSYNKERLKQLLKKTALPTHEQKIISGTLDFSSKKVEEVMTVLDDIFKLPITAILNFETIASILASGFSRIPIYIGEKSNICYVLLTKDLALLDPDEKVPVRVIVENTKAKYVCKYIPKGTTLDVVLHLFKDSRNHMLFITDNDDGSDEKEQFVIGLVTFEDIIEEIFQMEIVDETDTIFDNREKRKISFSQKTDLISQLLKPTKVNAPSENVKLSTYCFLSEVEEFSIKNLSPKVIIALLDLDIYYTTSGHNLPQDIVYIRGVPADYFLMILEGQMDVKIGQEELVFEAGAFRYFGIETLRKLAPFSPDYTIQGVTKTMYLKISFPVYHAALLATRFERFNEVPNITPNSVVYKYFSLITASIATPSTSK